MVFRGRVENGMIVPEGPISLPEGTEVTIIVRAEPTVHVAPRQKTVVIPLVRSARPGSVDLTSERIAAILGQQDASA
jgi:predicted DNA-binding antitoxin AbrB/MazE fold protein